MQSSDCNHCLEVIDVLGGFFTLSHRSSSLDGSAPLRAVQACTPFLEGNAYGFHLTTTGIGLRLDRFGNVKAVQLTPQARSKLSSYQTKLRRVVRQGHLDAKGIWLERLATGAWWPSGRSFNLWTGLLAKSRGGVWMRLTRAYNRETIGLCVRESVLAEQERYVPLVLEMSCAPLPSGLIRLGGEVACLNPIRPGCGLSLSDFGKGRTSLEKFHQFYSPDYFREKNSSPPTKKYKQLVAQSSGLTATDETVPACTLFVSKFSKVELRKTNRYLTPEGIKTRIREAPFEYAVIRNTCWLRVASDGFSFDIQTRGWSRKARHIRRRWVAMFGGRSDYSIRSITNYSAPQAKGEAQFIIFPPVWAATTPGWSTMVEGFSGRGYAGFRGLIWTDVLPKVLGVFEVDNRRGVVSIRNNVPIMRLIPVPRDLMNATFEVRGLDAQRC